MKNWKIWIDTGGTFTDCLALDPTDKEYRIKVLSSSVLRGKVESLLNDQTIIIQQQWQVESDIFENYLLRFPTLPHLGSFKIKQTSHSNRTLSIVEAFPLTLEKGIEFEITGNEEAPLLAIRMVTNTRLFDSLPAIHLRLGFTKGTNALLEKNGARVTLITTKGFADLPIIGNQQRPNLFQLNIPERWLPFEEVIEVQERLDAQGQIKISLETEEIQRIIGELKSRNSEAIAISFLHAYKNNIHEKILEEAILEAGFPYVSRSSALSSALKWLPRLQTTLVDAYLNPLLLTYLSGIEHTLLNGNTKSSLQIMTSAGALVPLVLFNPKDSLLSGPAGGVVGAAKLAQLSGFSKILTLDMGGTSTDTARYEGVFDFRYTTKLEELELQSPVLAIETVAAGGGSICYFEEGRLHVGPQSAGAAPGPACYGAGGPLTLSDVNILLGKMDPSCFSIPIFPKKAQDLFSDLINQMDLFYGLKHNPLEILKGLERIGNEKMADAIRSISIAKGVNPADYPLLAFGGAGGLHACSIAELLGIKTILIPYDAGILSAYGIGQAKIERYSECEIRMPLALSKDHSNKVIGDLSEKVRNELLKAGILPSEIGQPSISYFLRFMGQESALEIQNVNFEELPEKFKVEYHKIFGYFPSEKPIELVRILVRITTQEEEVFQMDLEIKSYSPQENHFLTNPYTQENQPVYIREDLNPGAIIYGPAILRSQTSSSFINKNWKCQIDRHGLAIFEVLNFENQIDTLSNESVQLTLFTNRFKSIAEEMGVQLQRTAFSVNVKERLDFSCALIDPNGYLLVNAPHIPVHLGSLGICTRLVKEFMPLEKGDVIITNHPAYGGSHLPDITLIQGVFSENSECIGYVINRAHHAEIGGKTPGSMPPDATFLFEEGVIIPPFYLAKNGKWHWEDLIEKLKNAPFPSRSVTENIADIHAGIASLNYGEKALIKLAKEFGIKTVHAYMEKVQVYAHQQVSNILDKFIHKALVATEFLDDGTPIKVKIYKENNLIYFDFNGTGGPDIRNLNANISIVYSVVLYVLRLLCPGDLPLNEGFLRGIKIMLPVNSLLHPIFPENEMECPAVVGGNTEISQRLTDTVLKAFEIAACSQGTMNNFLFGNEKFGYYETIGGGCGATLNQNGRSAIHQHMTNTRLTDIEELEFRYPVFVQKFAIRKESGGKGKWDGGHGIIREIQFLEPLSVTFISQHRKIAPYGLAGGENGKCGEQYFIFPNGEIEPLEGIFSKKIAAGTIFHLETPGGGGFEES